MKTLLALLILMSPGAVRADPVAQAAPAPAAGPKPVLILAVADPLTDRSEGKLKSLLAKWHKDLPFDRLALQVPPPETAEDLAAAVARLNRVGQAVGQATLPTFAPVGLEGWHPLPHPGETPQAPSAPSPGPPPAGPPGAGPGPPPGAPTTKAPAVKPPLTRELYWPALKSLKSDWIGLSTAGCEQTMPAQLQTYLEGFCDAMHEGKKKVVVWLSAHMLYRPGRAAFAAWLKQWDSRKVDYLVWMDMPSVTVTDAVPLSIQVPEILQRCAPDRAFFEWCNRAPLPTETREATKAYLEELRKWGAPNFCVVAQSRLLGKKEWSEFYRKLW
jgi:hypothetical protein